MTTIRNTSLTPHEYADAVTAHARQTANTSLYPGELFRRLNSFLQRPFEPYHGISCSPYMSPVERAGCFAIAYGLSTSSGMSMQPLTRPEEFRSLLENEARQEASILFLRGHPSPQWLLEIGAALNVDPTFFQHHFDIRSSIGAQGSFFYSSLPSAEDGILHLRFTTIGRRWLKGNDFSQAEVERLRLDDKLVMDEYLHVTSTRDGGNVGDSIVRSYHTHNGEFFSIEQQITISVQYIGSKWTVLVWSDAGRDLGEGPYGPWRGNRNQKSYFLPTLQHLPSLPFRSRQLAASAEKRVDGNVSQSVALLSIDYGKSLDKELMSVDAFYSVHELLRFCAFSTSQFLNLIDYTITADTGYASATDKQYNLSNLLYHQDLLETQAKHLRTTIRNIKQRGDPSWPHAPDRKGREKAEAAAESLLRDYEELLTRANEISKRCKVGVSVMMSLASIAESKRAISQAKKVEQLTFLAFFFIPLSFTTSFFGMNLGALGTGELAVWVWFAVSIPVLVFSFGLLKIMTDYCS